MIKNLLFLTLFSLAFVLPVCGDDPDAVKPSVVLRSEQIAGERWYYLEVTAAEELRKKEYTDLVCKPSADDACDPKLPVIGGLFKDGAYIAPVPGPFGIPLARPIVYDGCDTGIKRPCDADIKKFRIYLPQNPKVVGEAGKFTVVFYNYPRADGSIAQPWTAVPSILITRTLDSINTACGEKRNVIGFIFQAIPPETIGNRIDIADWFNTKLKPNPSWLVLKTNAATSGKMVVNPVQSVKVHSPGTSDKFTVCLTMTEDLPRETYNTLIEFKGPAGSEPPFEVLEPGRVDKLAPPVVRTGGSAADDPGEVGKRVIPNEKLDFTFTFYTGRVTKQAPYRVERDTYGIFDLRSTPFVIPIVKDEMDEDGDGGPGFHTLDWKPIVIDAKASTGKIEENTVSLNRINLGSDLEYRYFHSSSVNPTYYRVNFRAINASDRDFKLVEGKFNFEFRPVLGFLNRPIASSGRPVEDPLASTKTNKYIPGSWGYRIIPSIGFDFGKTYRNRNPAPGLIEQQKFFRGIFGLSIVVNPVNWVTFTIEDKFYSRYKWETGTQEINYLKASVDFALTKKFNVPQSVVFSYENGKQPPFDKEVVNTFKVGYRIQTNW